VKKLARAIIVERGLCHLCGRESYIARRCSRKRHLVGAGLAVSQGKSRLSGSYSLTSIVPALPFYFVDALLMGHKKQPGLLQAKAFK